MRGDVLFIVWRESVEALLVIGILFACLQRAPADVAARGRRFLTGGVVLGLAGALGLGMALLRFAEWFGDEREDIFQGAMMLVASALIVQMALWMRQHGRTLKRELEAGLGEHLAHGEGWGMAALAALAVAREGGETVVFLGGLGAARDTGTGVLVASALAGLALSVGTFYLLQAGSRLLSWRVFFRVSEVLLLLLGAALLVGATERALALGWMPPGLDPVWDTSAFLPDSGGLGGLLASFTGYRARPALTVLVVLALYAVGVLWGLRRASRPTVPVVPVAA